MAAFRINQIARKRLNIKSSGQQTSQLNFVYVGEYAAFLNCVLRVYIAPDF